MRTYGPNIKVKEAFAFGEAKDTKQMVYVWEVIFTQKSDRLLGDDFFFLKGFVNILDNSLWKIYYILNEHLILKVIIFRNGLQTLNLTKKKVV